MRLLFALLVVAACGTSDPTPPPKFHLLDHDEKPALLAVWGTTSDDVWVVGSRPSGTAGPTILHYDGTAWSHVDSGQQSLDLWWVFGFPTGEVLFSGSGGTILRYRNGVFEKLPTPSVAGTIFGMWGPSPDDFWAVGHAGTAGGVVWHYDGQAFTSIPIPTPTPGFVFKVHGQSSNDVWMSCDMGLTLHWDGNALTRVQTSTQNSLFSIITTPKIAITVGGVGGTGDLLENTSGDWSAASLQAEFAWRGTAAVGEDLAVVGENGSIAQRTGSTWTALSQGLTDLNFHSAWLDEKHGLWAVGGLFDGLLSDGMLVYYGTQTIPEVAQ